VRVLAAAASDDAASWADPGRSAIDIEE